MQHGAILESILTFKRYLHGTWLYFKIDMRYRAAPSRAPFGPSDVLIETAINLMDGLESVPGSIPGPTEF